MPLACGSAGSETQVKLMAKALGVRPKAFADCRWRTSQEVIHLLCLRINSIKSLIEEAKDLVALSQKMTSLGEQRGKNKSSQNETLKQI